MKKVILNLLLLSSAILTIQGCNVDDSFQEDLMISSGSKLDVENNSNNSNFDRKIVVGITIGWDEWGRKRFDCGRAGLCRIRIKTITIGNREAPIYRDENGNLFADILIDLELLNSGENLDFLPIDEDIYFTHNDGTVFLAKKGFYPKNNNLGKDGGYTLPIYID